MSEVRQVIIDNYPIDVAKMETHTLEAEVTDHPTEKGSTITDHVRLNPIEVTLECLISDTPIGTIADDPTRRLGDIEIEGETDTTIPTPSEDAYTRLKRIREARETVTIETSLDRFENMILTRLTVPRSSETSGGLTFEVTFRQVVIVENLRVTVRVADPRGNGKTDIGLALSKLVDGKKILWRKGKPPGRSSETTPPGVITGQEIVIVQEEIAPVDFGIALPTIGIERHYVHQTTKKALTTQELNDFSKDLNRDAKLLNKHTEQVNKKTDALKKNNQARTDKAKKLYDKNPILGKFADPALFGI